MRVEDDLKIHNQITINNTLEFYKTERKCCAIQATGTGKTYLILRLLEIYNDNGKKAVIFAPNREIIKQTKKKMEEFDLENAIFYTYQKLIRMTDEEIEQIECDIIICDELHRVGAKKWGEKIQYLLDTHADTKLFGTTATNIRCVDGRDIAEEYFDNNKACEISLAEALVRKIIPTMPLYISGLYTFDEEYNNLSERIANGNNSDEEKLELQKELQAARKSLEKSNGVPEIIKKYIINYNGKYIVFCKDKKHLEQMENIVINWFRQAGFNENIFSYPYYSDCTEVKNNLKLFKLNQNEGLKLLFVIDKLNEGLHLKEIDGCILLRTTVSNIIYYQQIGRVIDAGADNKRVILDLVSNFNSLKSFNFKNDLKDNIEKRKRGDFKDYGCGADDFEVDEFSVVDMVQDVINVFQSIDSRIHNTLWTDEEIAILKKYYPLEGGKCNKRLNNRTKESTSTKASELGIKFNGNWTDEEIAILKKYYPLEHSKCYKRFTTQRSKQAIMMKAKELGISVRKRWTKAEKELFINLYKEYGEKAYHMMPTKSSRQCIILRSRIGLKLQSKVRFTENENNIIKEHYSEMGKDIMSLLPNRNWEQIKRRASSMGIKIKAGSSKYKYVYQKKNGKYAIRFQINNKNKFFGDFDTEEEAAKVAKEKALEYGKKWKN